MSTARACGVAVVVAVATAVLALLGPGAGSAGPPAPSFRLADGSAGCVYSAGSISCRGVAVKRGLSLDAVGAPRFATSPVAWTDATPVLRPASPFSRAGIKCRALASSIMCSNRAGSFIVVSRARISASVPPMVSPQ